MPIPTFLYMNHNQKQVLEEGSIQSPMADEPVIVAEYEAPCVEAVLTSQEVEREILYAGTLTRPPFDNIPD